MALVTALLVPALSSAKEKGGQAAWVGESALVQWGTGPYGDQGWIRYNRHRGAANYVYIDGHVERLQWRDARPDHFPDHRVRNPLAGPPN